MKKITACIAALILSILPMTALADDDIKVIINDQVIEFDVPPQIIEERTMVPMRKIFETLGAKVEWVPEDRLILASGGTKIIAMEIDSYSFSMTDLISGKTDIIELDVPPQIVSERTLVPVRAVSEALDKTVDWDEQTKSVIIK